MSDMNSKEAFNTLGLIPTSDMEEIKATFRKEYRKLQKQLSKARVDENEDRLEKLGNKIQRLNESYNYLNLRSGSLESEVLKAEYTSTREKEVVGLYGETVGRQILKAELESAKLKDRDREDNLFFEMLEKNIKMTWKPMDIPLEVDEITLGVYLRGGNIMIKGEMIDIPQGLEGVYIRTLENNRLQFIMVKVKNSVTFDLKANGDLVLKNLPEKYDKGNNGVKFKFSKVDFDLTNDNLVKELKNGTKIYNTNITKYGSKETVKIEVLPSFSEYKLFSEVS